MFCRHTFTTKNHVATWPAKMIAKELNWVYLIVKSSLQSCGGNYFKKGTFFHLPWAASG